MPNVHATMIRPVSKLGMQLSLELVTDLGSQLGPAEADDQAAILVSTGIKRTVNGSKE